MKRICLQEINFRKCKNKELVKGKVCEWKREGGKQKKYGSEREKGAGENLFAEK